MNVFQRCQLFPLLCGFLESPGGPLKVQDTGPNPAGFFLSYVLLLLFLVAPTRRKLRGKGGGGGEIILAWQWQMSEVRTISLDFLLGKVIFFAFTGRYAGSKALGGLQVDTVGWGGVAL